MRPGKERLRQVHHGGDCKQESSEFCPFSQIKIVSLQGTGITVTAWSQENFNRLTRFSDYQMGLQALEIPSLASPMASEFPSAINPPIYTGITVVSLWVLWISHQHVRLEKPPWRWVIPAGIVKAQPELA